MAMPAPDLVTEIPSEVQTALGGILTDIYSEDVRLDIVTAITWAINNISEAAVFLNSLGLTVHNGQLCYTDADVVPVYSQIPQNIADTLQGILTDVYGPDLRNSIVRVLRWAESYISTISGAIEDLGLTVQDGKLCAIFGTTQA